MALGDVAGARRITDVARDAGLGRELRFETVHKLVRALGVKLVAAPGA